MNKEEYQHQGIEKLKAFAREQYDADLEPVIRCKDCKHSDEASFGSFWCYRRVMFLVLPNDFCSHGERRNSG